MSQPEISRRCLACGASVRASARFCPQCGALMKADDAPAPPVPTPETHPAPDIATISGEILRETFSNWQTSTPTHARETQGNVEPPAQTHAPDERAAHATHVEPARAPQPPQQPPAYVPPPAPPAPAPDARQQRHAAPLAEAGPRPRMERLREASMGVLEEASEDTGLRFVLVAVVLFLLFLFLLLVNSALR